MRSFSLLIIAAILFADAKTPRLSEQVTRQAQTALLHYAKEEKDWRGYIKGKTLGPSGRAPIRSTGRVRAKSLHGHAGQGSGEEGYKRHPQASRAALL